VQENSKNLPRPELCLHPLHQAGWTCLNVSCLGSAYSVPQWIEHERNKLPWSISAQIMFVLWCALRPARLSPATHSLVIFAPLSPRLCSRRRLFGLFVLLHAMSVRFASHVHALNRQTSQADVAWVKWRPHPTYVFAGLGQLRSK
jgi:hypothetical protein